MTCRICLEDDGVLISACRCKGFDHGYTHEECLRKWVETSDRTRCEICNEKYTITERCGCSFSEYMYKFCTFQAESDVERHLLSVGTFLLSILYLIICFFTPDEGFTQMAALNTYTILISLMSLQIYDRGKSPYFVLNVGVIWKLSYVATVLVSIALRDTFAEDACGMNCALIDDLKYDGCVEPCPYAVRRNVLRKDYGSAIALNALNLSVLVLLRALTLCFTHKRRRIFSEYSGGVDEEKGLLSDESSSPDLSGASSSDMISSSVTSGALSSGMSGESSSDLVGV